MTLDDKIFLIIKIIVFTPWAISGSYMIRAAIQRKSQQRFKEMSNMTPSDQEQLESIISKEKLLIQKIYKWFVITLITWITLFVAIALFLGTLFIMSKMRDKETNSTPTSKPSENKAEKCEAGAELLVLFESWESMDVLLARKKEYVGRVDRVGLSKYLRDASDLKRDMAFVVLDKRIKAQGDGIKKKYTDEITEMLKKSGYKKVLVKEVKSIGGGATWRRVMESQTIPSETTSSREASEEGHRLDRGVWKAESTGADEATLADPITLKQRRTGE